MTEAKHTPLPWEYAERPRNVRPQFIILDALGNEVVFLTCHQQAMKVYGGDLKREQNIMRQIVRAVNNHDELVEACERAIKVAGRMEISKFAEITSIEYRHDTIKYFKQILAKAKGES